jgi:hypothetical protein
VCAQCTAEFSSLTSTSAPPPVSRPKQVCNNNNNNNNNNNREPVGEGARGETHYVHIIIIIIIIMRPATEARLLMIHRHRQREVSLTSTPAPPKHRGRPVWVQPGSEGTPHRVARHIGCPLVAGGVSRKTPYVTVVNTICDRNGGWRSGVSRKKDVFTATACYG